MQQTLTGLKGETDCIKITAEYFNAPLAIMDRISREKSNIREIHSILEINHFWKGICISLQTYMVSATHNSHSACSFFPHSHLFLGGGI